ncbi:MAG: recombinase family protein [Pseudomonadota bacterium]
MLKQRIYFIYLYKASGDNQPEMLDAKRARCKSFGETQGWTLQHVFIDTGVTGQTLDRPEFGKLINALKATRNANPIVVIDQLSQIGRNPSVCLNTVGELEKAGAQLVVRDTHGCDLHSPEAQFVLTVRASLIELEDAYIEQEEAEQATT